MSKPIDTDKLQKIIESYLGEDATALTAMELMNVAIEQLKEDARTSRNRAIEEAAKVAEQFTILDGDEFPIQPNPAASAIRALKSQ